ncbi:MAG: glycosyl hydrolase family 8 [Cytophagales bacterium]
MIRKLFLSCSIVTLSLFAQINSNSPARPFNSNTSYANGIMPSNLPSGGTYGKSQDAASAYESWKSGLVQSCSNGSRVLFDDNSSTVSEGIAYGMLLSAYAGDKPLFDNLWKYYKANSNGNGVMHWKISGCTGTSGQNGATDAELDAAMALLVAAEQWPNANNPYVYKTEAATLISKIRQYEIHPSSYQTLNGDAWGTGSSCRNPSYFAPAYYRQFANAESSQSTFWNNVVSASNTFLIANRNSTTGLVSNWSDNNATPNSCNGPNEFGWDAIRNPWRMANDYLWYGPSAATAGNDICSKMSNWAKNNANQLKGPLSQSAGSPSQGSYQNGTFSMMGLAFMGTSGSTYQSALNTAYSSTVNLGNNEAYFSRTLRCITLFMMTGNFWKPGSASSNVTGTISITLPANNASFTQGTSVSFTSSASISSGTIDSVVYYEGTTKLGKSTSSPYSLSYSKFTPGTHAISAKLYSAGNLIATSSAISVIITGNSLITTNGLQDLFDLSTEVTSLTGGYNTASCSGITTAATMGIYWYQDVDTTTKFKARKYRKGDGKLMYEVSQEANSYNAFGFNFGEYCVGTTKSKYTIDLSNNAVMKFTLAAPSTNTTSLDVKIQLKDLDGTLISYSNKALTTSKTVDLDNWYKYDIGFSRNHTNPDYTSLAKGTSADFTFDFKNTLSVKGYNYPADINANNNDFDFKNVVEVIFTVLNASVDAKYNPLAITNQQIIFSNFVLGDANSGTTVCTTPAAPVAGTVSAVCQGATATALTATGTAGLSLQWYGTAATGGTASTTATVPSTTNSGTSTYYVSQKVANSTCEGPRTAITFTVNPASTPSVSASTTNTTITNGTSVTFTSSVSNVGTAATYQWRKNGNNISSATSATYTTTDITNNDKFDVIVTSSDACANPKTATSNQVTMIVSSVDDIIFANMSMFPNPAKNEILVSGLNNNFEYLVSDNTGRIITSGNSSEKINIENIENGAYILQLNIDGKKKAVKFIKGE